MVEIIINPYKNKIDTLHTIWHEVTHYIQSNDERIITDFLELKKNRNIEYFNKKKEQSLLLESQANLNASMILYLHGIQYELSDDELEKLKRGIILASNDDFNGGYCDFELTIKALQELETKKEFCDSFFQENGDINYLKLYEYTYQQSEKQKNDIIDFAKENNINYLELLKNKKLMEDEKGPLYRISKAKKDYFNSQPLTKQEELEDSIYNFRKVMNEKKYKNICDRLKDFIDYHNKENSKLSELIEESIKEITRETSNQDNKITL